VSKSEPAEQPNATSEDRLLARRAAVISMDYVMRAFRRFAGMNGDSRSGLVAYAIVAANTAHLDPLRGAGVAPTGPDGVLPNDARRPISIAKLAKLLGLPFETTRQQVRKLMETGTCVRVEGGLIVPQEVLQRPEIAEAVMQNVADIRQLLRDLQTIGLQAEPLAEPGLSSGEARSSETN
jgi:hypothetical protein